MIPGLPNPWLILGLVLFMLAACVGSFFYGGHVETLAWRVKIAEQEVKAANLLAEETAKARAGEAKYQALLAQTEQKDAERNKKVDAQLAAVRRDIHDRGGLFLPGRGSGGQGAVRDASPTSAVAAGTPASCRIRDEDADALLDMAGDADRLGAYAVKGHEYAKLMDMWRAEKATSR